MTVVTTRPNASTFTGGTFGVAVALTGAASIHAALNDNSDSSYGTWASPSPGSSSDPSIADIAFPSATIPSGAVVSARSLRLRSSVPASPCVVLLTGSTTNITWSTPTTITFIPAPSNALGTGTSVSIGAAFGQGSSFRAYELYLDTTYVTKPAVTPSAPTGAITSTNIPACSWADTLDADGGVQTSYQVRIFTAAQYGIGGFDPATSPATTDSGLLTGAATTWSPTTPIADGTYRAYVRVGQTVNGTALYSAWAYSAFTLTVALPAVPTIDVAADSAKARNTIVITTVAGVATTDAYELQRSTDSGATWAAIRQLAAGYLTPSGGTITLYDYEAANGSTTTSYRARSLHNYSGVYAASAWGSDASPGQWSSTSWWLKDPISPGRNQAITVRSFPGVVRAARQGVFLALGATVPIVVDDTRGLGMGVITLRVDDDAHTALLNTLLGTQTTLLLQGPSTQHFTDAYVRVGDLSYERVVDNGLTAPILMALPITFVASPAGNPTVWPP